ncbi:transcription factor IIIB 50 kDa subunit-like isoform X2 [Pristis pectinata]|nr:transcription factor IIIB 50 kDa subunit-like isoform X2 [Pristis pectinata]XP_051897237.1 transcription factor IIIB 50 kDa subunit-like isoform X2 [Pristis pectinata]
MPGQTKCPECGSSAVEEDTHYSQNHMVCTECGFLLTEGLLTTTRSEETFLQAVKYTKSTAEDKTPCRNKVQGVKRVRDLCQILRVRPVVEDTATELYVRAYDHRDFLHVTLEKKEALVGCCIHTSCRQHNWPLTMGTLCSLLHVESTLFSSVYLQLVKELQLDVPTLSLQDLVKTHCNGFILFQNSGLIPPRFQEDKDKVVARAVQLVELASETWLVTGRHPVPIITAAAYLAWQSLLPGHRLKCSLGRFCKLAGITLPPPTSQRLKELTSVLIRLASQLPWLRGQQVDAKTVVKYTSDILRHRTLLLSQTLDCIWAESTSAQTDPREGCVSEAGENSSQPQDQLSQAPETGSSRKRTAPVFLPPCLTQTKRRNFSLELERSCSNQTTGEEEISDSEIEQYLRTPEEVATFQAARAIL